MRVRLQRYLAQAGVASRRRSEDLIADGAVRVNGRIVTRPGMTVDPHQDRVTVAGRAVEARFPEAAPGAGVCIALHKPRGVVTTRSDPGGRRTIFELVEDPEHGRLVYVGRLDRDTEGLLLLTDDGRLAHRLTHPSWEVERTYEADVRGPLDEQKLVDGARRGIALEDGTTAPFRARILRREGRGESSRRRLELILHEGRKREVRRILAACGGRVERLIRTGYGTVELGELRPGETRRLTPRELTELRAVVGLDTNGPEGAP